MKLICKHYSKSFSLHNFENKNIVLGKTGYGKSYLFTQITNQLMYKPEVGKVIYISPERGGSLTYDPNIESDIRNSLHYLIDKRTQNQVTNFRQQSAVQFNNLKLKILEKLEKDIKDLEDDKPLNKSKLVFFKNRVDSINSLLDGIFIKEDRLGFKIYDKKTNQPQSESIISSGQSQLISLAIEILAFKEECDSEKDNYLFIDAPDVHLHADFQVRLAKFLIKELTMPNTYIFLLTHSTAFLNPFTEDPNARVVFMQEYQTKLEFVPIDEEIKRILPIFGAHPLSNIFNENPILLLEGEDDESIWRQAIKSSQGKLKFYPCSVGGINNLHKFEKKTDKIINSIYDSPRAFSLRDKDNCKTNKIENYGSVICMRLNCRASENLLLSDDVLEFAKLNWETLKKWIKYFIMHNSDHPCFSEMKVFVNQGMDRKNANLKPIVYVLLQYISKKPWTVLVGQVIAEVFINRKSLNTPDSLCEYLGEKTCMKLLNINLKKLSIICCDAQVH